jgi:hypothetical protein
MAGSTKFRLPFQPSQPSAVLVCKRASQGLGQGIGPTRERYHATCIPFSRCMATHVTEYLVSLACYRHNAPAIYDGIITWEHENLSRTPESPPLIANSLPHQRQARLFLESVQHVKPQRRARGTMLYFKISYI